MRDRTYIKTHYRVDCGYVWGKGIDDKPLLSFYNEVKALLGELGFMVLRENGEAMRGSCLEMVRGKEWLYCHPMDLSGPVLIDQVDKIKSQLLNARCFRLRMTDTYETGIDYSEDELRVLLAREIPELRYMIYVALTTVRSNRFFNALQLHDILYMSGGVRHRFAREIIKSFEDDREFRKFTDTTNVSNKKIRQIVDVVNSTFLEMVEQGYIICMDYNGKKLYRSRNKGELQNLKLTIPASRIPNQQGLLSMLSTDV